MLKSLPAARKDECLADAAISPMALAGIEYPEWYLHRWHFLPEGYLSRRSAALYDTVIRRVYNLASEARLHAALARAMARRQPRDILEIGCGPGNALLAIRNALSAARLVGMDLSPFLLELARDRLPEGAAELVHGDVRHLPWPDGYFDAVVSQHVLGHLPREAAARAWDEADRVLRPGGRLYLLEHGWHPRSPGPLRLVARKRLLGGIIRLDAFRKD
jgi:ubiquinone/menaquinone biosynthesis C-methylase UbiE